MRTILNISIPESMASEVKKEVKDGKFASTSEFFRHLLRLWNTEKLYRDIQKSERQFKKGNYKILKSLKDLKKSEEDYKKGKNWRKLNSLKDLR